MLYKLFAGTLSLAFASAQSTSFEDGSLTIDPTVGESLACHLFTDDFTLFELSGIDTTYRDPLQGNRERDYYVSSNVEFKYCSYFDGTEYFARYLDTSGRNHEYIAVTNSDYIPEKVEVVTQNEDEIIGVKTTRHSDTPCQRNETLTWSFESTLLCDET